MLNDYIQTTHVEFKPYEIYGYNDKRDEVWLPMDKFVNPPNGYTKEQYLAVNFLTAIAAKARQDMGQKAISPEMEYFIDNKAALLLCHREGIIDKEPDNVPPQSLDVVNYLMQP